MARIDPYDEALQMFDPLGYKDGWEGFRLDTSSIPAMYEEYFGFNRRKWILQPKNFKAGAYAGYRKGWERGYKESVANELWLHESCYQMRQETPEQHAPVTGPWREEFEQGPPIRPMAIPSHLKRNV